MRGKINNEVRKCNNLTSIIYLLKAKEQSRADKYKSKSEIKHTIIPRHHNATIAVEFITPGKYFPISSRHNRTVLLCRIRRHLTNLYDSRKQ